MGLGTSSCNAQHFCGRRLYYLAQRVKTGLGTGALKMREWKMQEWKMQERSRVEIRQKRYHKIPVVKLK